MEKQIKQKVKEARISKVFEKKLRIKIAHEIEVYAHKYHKENPAEFRVCMQLYRFVKDN